VSDADAVFAAILAAPDDDLPRTALAEWLDDLGQPERASFIRVQCELARLVVRPLAEVLFHPRPTVPNLVTRDVVSGTLGGSPEGIVAGATVDWTVSGGLDRADGFWTGVGVVENVGVDRHGLTVRLRPVPNEGSRPERDAAREKRRALRVRARQLFDPHSDRWFPVPPGYGLNWHLTTDPWDDARPGYVVRRGFVDELRCDLRRFLGGACGRCDGRGSFIPRAAGVRPGDRIDCPECDGSGAVAGLDLAAVWGSHPVRRVVLSDREPQHQRNLRDDLPGDYWWWLRSANHARADTLPAKMHRLMAPDATHAGGEWSGFTTRDRAVDAASLAAVSLGRAAAAAAAAFRRRVNSCRSRGGGAEPLAAPPEPAMTATLRLHRPFQPGPRPRRNDPVPVAAGTYHTEQGVREVPGQVGRVVGWSDDHRHQYTVVRVEVVGVR